MKADVPTISVVTATKNSIRTIRASLSSIREQEYPQDKIEIIVADGGSTDGTLDVARMYKARIYRIDPKKQNAEYNKSIGVANASNEIIAMIDHDNILPHRRWMKNMVRPFMEQPDVVGVETLRYHYEPKGELLDRYFALFGCGDPIVWYLGKSDRLSYMFEMEKKPYSIVTFTEKNMPTIGANGFLVRRGILTTYAQTKPGRYFDMDVNIDLIRNGFDTFAFVHDGIIHKTGYGNIWSYFARRMLFMGEYRVGRTNRRFQMVSKANIWRLIWAVVASISIVIPLYDGVRGWRKIHDRAWFLHPLMALGFVLVYSWVIMKHYLSSYAHHIVAK
jgi:glycosyltransferase involved in cell wall biosynthesis